MHAVRILGVDAANLMTQLAVYRATVEELLDASGRVDERSWQPVLSDDEQTITAYKMPVDQQQVVQQILMLINGLR